MKTLFVRFGAKSARDLLKAAFAIVILCFLAISATSLLYVYRIARESDAQTSNIESANSLSRMAKKRVVEESWYVVAGREDFEAGGIYAEVERLKTGLQELYGGTSSAAGRQIVLAALQAADTLAGYVEQLERQLAAGAPVSYRQATFTEIDRVSDTLYDVLQEYTYAETAEIARAGDDMQRTVVFIMLLLALFTLAVIAIAIGAYRMLREAVERPNQELEAMADRILKGDLTTQVPPPGMEELNKLATSINLMSARIQTLVDKNIEEQQNLQKSEMRALQAQITPHFLYNTLDTIVWLAECGHNEEVVRLTVAFSNYYRVALSRGQDFISVAQEVEHVRDYLVIQQVRYGDLLHYAIDVEPAMAERRMLKLLLQPIVENALYHGLKNKRGGGAITVRGRLLFDGSLYFCVEDDGVGMQPETLENLRRGIAAGILPEELGYGLYNVNRRLRLYYAAVDLTVQSEYGKGTRVEFVLPKLGEPKEEARDE